MSYRRRLLLFLSLSLWLLQGERLNASAGGVSMVQEEIMQFVALARTAHDASARTAAAQHVAGLITPLSALEVSEMTISEIEGLLDSPYDPVRYWTARALGNLGPRARTAVPKLLELLPKADCLQGSKTSASGIRFALKQMGVAPPPVHCEPS